MRQARSAVEIFLWSRGVIWLGALLALATLVPMRNPRAGRWDDPALTHDLGGVTDVWARWDSVHFLRIAEHGYSASEAAFYPLYPALVAGVGRALGGHYVLGGDPRLAARRARRVRPARTARGGTARRERGQAGAALPRALPDGVLSPGGVLGVALPLALPGRVRARRTRPLRVRRDRRRARDADATDRHRARCPRSR